MKILLFIALGLIGSMAIAQNPSAEHTRQTGSAFSASTLQIGCSYLGTPYVAHTLDVEGEERLVIRRNEVDCIIFVEYTLAEAMGGSFEENLKRIRYRDGVIDGYPSRLHYTSDWIENGIRNGFLRDVTAEEETPTMRLSLSFMSTHAKRYKKLAHSPKNVARIAQQEQRLTGKTVHWIPKNQLPDDGLPWIQDGDIIALTTQVKGLDIAHVGFAIYQKGKLHLLHASSTLKKVVISQTTLRSMLERNASWSGIRVIRLKESADYVPGKSSPQSADK